ncbi:MAG: peptide chain release factor N(5)-glutamine methyltransferase [Proteobacteria bacterium]|jgi:release factor glutamine methyltransferase|nr:peptide chain release factor N(5)-glutamine methyltransferase [Pseudomonadota bacterium]
MKLKEVLDRTTQFFKEKKIESARLDAELLIADALKMKNRVELYLKFDQPLKESELQLCRDFVRRRSQGEPVAYILGYKDFYRSRFQVDSRVLIPRPETEILVEEACGWALASKDKSQELLLVDLGCGSGCIGISVALELQKMGFTQLHLVLLDQSSEALMVAKTNAQTLLKELSFEMVLADARTYEFGREFDIALGNPPYIDPSDSRVETHVKAFEPAQALYSSDNGLQDLKAWSSQVIPFLKPRSFLGLEMGFEQGPEMERHLQQIEVFSQVKILKDLAKLPRHVIGIKSSQ